MLMLINCLFVEILYILIEFSSSFGILCGKDITTKNLYYKICK